jgi:8-oxo-dGTP pyrophosphatase MutT (NUDIX family)
VSEAQKPKPAATVILLRAAEPKRFEVFLTRRPDGMPFLGGMYCFPGGGVNQDDFAPRITDQCFGLTPMQARKIIGAHFSPRQALGFWIAGIRELFEECGLLFAVDSAGNRFPQSRAQANRAIDAHRRLLDKSLSFVSLIESNDLRCDLSRLTFLSHWQTPAQTSLRFDTHFFLAALPADQTPLAASYEVTHSLWLSPDEAMRRSARGELPMIFPTFASLRTLADFDTIESMLKEFCAAESP